MRGNKQPARETCQIWHHKDGFALLHDLPDELIKACLDQALHLRHGAPRFFCLPFFCRRRSDANRHFVTGQDFEHFVRRDKNLAAISGDGEAVTMLGSFDGGIDALILCLELLPEALELRHRIAIEHSRYRLLICPSRARHGPSQA